MKPYSPIPLATYRLQLNRDFTFAQATDVVPYLADLGISHCYISPCLKARPGSMHGYDIVDHNSFNPEIGSAEEFDRFVAALHERGMGLILDIVPNHMGIMGSDNAWWLDVLENGQASIYAEFFDIDWHPLKEELHGKVLVPVLHDHYGVVLESGDLKLIFNPDRGEFDISYHEHRFPLDPKEYSRILQRCDAGASANRRANGENGEPSPDVLELQSLIASFGHLPSRPEAIGDRIAERNRDKEIHKRRLAELAARSDEIGRCIAYAIQSINGDPADPASFEELHEIIKAQAFRLANWRVASDDINYRRFFDTNDLAGIRVEKEEVFEASHRLVLRLVAEGKVDGFRLDHPDGLYNPVQYFERLRKGIADAIASSSGTVNSESHRRYVVIEKILTGAERLPPEWTVDGTTGYDFANLVNGLFVDSSAVMRMERIYRNFIADEIDFEELAYTTRKLIIRVALVSELNVLANMLTRIALSRRRTCDFTTNSLRDALTEIVASFPVYRTYVSETGLSEYDERYIQKAVDAAKWRSPAFDTSIFDFIGGVILTHIAEGQNPAYKNSVLNFAMKFQQFTSPVMAKGIEDTAFYRYNRLISLNDVGSDLHRFGVPVSEFHTANRGRVSSWPHAMLATSTHDSKRSEDVRARINVLSELSGLWRLRVREWRRINRNRRRNLSGRPAPRPNDEYLIYQTLVGALPFGLNEKSDKNDWESFSARIEAYMLKAIREAKRNTSWVNRNADYEDAVTSFVKSLLGPGPKNRFLADFLPFQRQVARLGMWNSLAQTLLKLTCPGVPDTYQGNEVWDFSLVDPDNRRQVDYKMRQQAFESLRQHGGISELEIVRRLLESPEDGRIKLHLIWKTLCFRQEHADLFQQGDYLVLGVAGAKADRVLAFARKYQDSTILIIVPRLVAGLMSEANAAGATHADATPANDTHAAAETTNASAFDRLPIGPEVWGETHVLLPDSGRVNCRNVFTGEILELEGQISLAQALANFPVALLSLE
jgi:(1->4)-alpha-D-glucan 1-alpha-D-glucosylmutase